MTCSVCGGENPSAGRFCIFCGAPLIADIGPQGEAPPEEETEHVAAAHGDRGTTNEQLVSLQTTVEGIREDLFRLLNRLSDAERQIRELSPTSLSPQPQRPAAVPPSPPMSSAIPPGATAVPPSPATTTAPSGFVLSRVGATAGAPPRPPGARIFDTMAGWNWEWLVGGNWLARVGIVALIIGVGFFLKLAFDNDWIGETGRVALGIVGGVTLLGAGEFWQRKYPIWAQPLTGGGIALLFLSIFAAFSLYDLINNVTAFGLFFLITLAAAGLALKNESMSIAILGIVGGFITPILLRDKLPDSRLLISYVLVLDLGVLGLATFRNWRWFTLLALAGSLGLYWFWYHELDPSLLLSQLGITFIFVIFMGATTLFHILWRRASGPADQALMVLNAAAYFAVSYGLLFDEIRPWMGGFTLLLSVVYGLLAYAVLGRSREQVYLGFFALGIAAVFLTIAVPVQLGGPWISVAWAVEGAVMIYLSFTLRMPQLRLIGLGVFASFAAYLLFIDTPDALGSDFTPFFNVFLVAYALVVSITYLLAYLFYRERENLQPWEKYLFPAFLVAGNLFLTITVPIQAVGRLDRGDVGHRGRDIDVVVIPLGLIRAAPIQPWGIRHHDHQAAGV